MLIVSVRLFDGVCVCLLLSVCVCCVGSCLIWFDVFDVCCHDCYVSCVLFVSFVVCLCRVCCVGWCCVLVGFVLIGTCLFLICGICVLVRCCVLFCVYILPWFLVVSFLSGLMSFVWLCLFMLLMLVVFGVLCLSNCLFSDCLIV